MCFSSKASFSAFAILVCVSLILFVRNKNYDRYIAPFIFALSLIQLVEFGIHNGNVGKNTAGASLYIILWLQCFVLFLGVFLFMKNEAQSTERTLLKTTGKIFTFIYGIILVFAVISVFTIYKGSFSGSPGPSGHIEWYKNGGFLLGNLGILYLAGIFLPLFLLFLYFLKSDKNNCLASGGTLLLLLYGIFSFIFVRLNYPENAFSSMWCFLSVGFGVLVLITSYFS